MTPETVIRIDAEEARERRVRELRGKAGKLLADLDSLAYRRAMAAGRLDGMPEYMQLSDESLRLHSYLCASIALLGEMLDSATARCAELESRCHSSGVASTAVASAEQEGK